MTAETLTSRVKRIISGSAHALIAAIEDLAPEAVMEEAIREIDLATDDVRAELGRVVAGKHLASKRLMEENKRHSDLAEQIEHAVDQGREDLAKAGIEKQLDIEAQLPILEATIADAATKEKELEGYVTALLAKRREMQEELLSFREARRAAEAGTTADGKPGAGSGVEGKVSRAENAFDRMMARQAGLPGMRGRASGKSAAELKELEELSRTNRVEERLAQLKAGREKE